MAVATIAPSDVKKGAGKVVSEVRKAGAIIDAGEICYILAGVALLATSNTEPAAAVRGMAVNSAEAIGQNIEIVTEGEVIVGSGIADGTTYVVSPTPGKINAADDALMISDEYVSVVGVGRSTDRLLIGRVISGEQVP